MRWQQVGIGGVAHFIVERVEVGPAGGPAWRAACGPWYDEARFAHGGGKACRGCEREKRAGRRAARIEANLPIIRAMHDQAAASLTIGKTYAVEDRGFVGHLIKLDGAWATLERPDGATMSDWASRLYEAPLRPSLVTRRFAQAPTVGMVAE